MGKEMTDESIVVWYPSTLIPNTRELTSICLLHDRVMLCNRLFEPRFQDSLFLAHLRREADHTGAIDFDAAIKVLACEDIIQMIDINRLYEMRDKFTKMSTPSIPHGLRERFKDVDKALFKPKQIEDIKAGLKILSAFISYLVSKASNYPLITNDITLWGPQYWTRSPQIISTALAESAICELALPDVKVFHIDDLLEARHELKDELLEFRAGTLKLTWLLRQEVKDTNDLERIRHEANFLTSTIIKGALLSLENRIRQHKKKCIRRILLSGSRVLVEATKLFLPGGATEKMISGGKTFLQLATEIDNAKLPEDQVAMYLYKLRGKLKEG